MIDLFKTGSYLTADNLNTAQLAYGLPGIISGASVYSSATNVLSIQKGIIKFSDGSIVSLDGTDYLDISGLSQTTYYVYLVKYGEDVSLEINITTPTDYIYVTLAVVTVTNDSVSIVNENPSATANCNLVLEGNNLVQNAIYSTSELSVSLAENETLGIKYLNCITQASASEGSLCFGFLYPSWSIRNIKILGTSSADTILAVNIIVNGTTISLSNNIIYNSGLSLSKYTSVQVLDKLEGITEGTPCSIKITISQTLSNEEQGTDLQLYGLKLDNG